jgi:hypothetical protein
MKPIFFFDADGVTLKTDLSWLDPFDLDQQAVTDFFVNEFIDCVTGKTDLREVLPKHLERR